MAELRCRFPVGTRFLVNEHRASLDYYLPEFEFELADRGTSFQRRFGGGEPFYVLVYLPTSEERQIHSVKHGLRPVGPGAAAAFWVSSEQRP
jgi:hypothetical protein